MYALHLYNSFCFITKHCYWLLTADDRRKYRIRQILLPLSESGVSV